MAWTPHPQQRRAAAELPGGPRGPDTERRRAAGDDGLVGASDAVGVHLLDDGHHRVTPDLLGRVGCAAAPLANAVQRARPVRRLLQAATGLVADRPLPPYVRSRDRFDRWFARRERATDSAAVRGEVILWDDTWVRYHEPGIGRAAVDQEQMNRMMAIVQDTVVVRGDQPMAPGEVIALTPPPRPADESANQTAGATEASAEETVEPERPPAT